MKTIVDVLMKKSLSDLDDIALMMRVRSNRIGTDSKHINNFIKMINEVIVDKITDSDILYRYLRRHCYYGRERMLLRFNVSRLKTFYKYLTYFKVEDRDDDFHRIIEMVLLAINYKSK